MRVDLHFDGHAAEDAGVHGHPQLAMKALGIEYSYAYGVPTVEGWVFEDCTNLPDPLPPYLRVIKSPRKSGP